MVLYLGIGKGLLLIRSGITNIDGGARIGVRVAACDIGIFFVHESEEASMKIIKAINNNVALAVNEQGHELVIMGKGVGFQKKMDDIIDDAVIEKVFVLETDELSEKLMDLLGEIPAIHLEIADEIVNYAKENFDAKISDNVYLTLTDHISFAIARHEKGMLIRNVMLWEIKKFYKDEFKIGLKALEIIKERLGIQLGEDEAGFIALHIVNARTDGQAMKTTLDMTQVVQDVLNIVTYHFNVVLDESSLNYTRFVTHLQYFAQRLLRNEIVDSGDDFLFDQVQVKYPESFACTGKIDAYLQKAHHATLTKDERVYLTLHIHRVTERNRTNE